MNSVSYCQLERTEELNKRILNRTNPSQQLQMNFSPRSVPTRYVKFPILDCRMPAKTPIVKRSEYNMSTMFNPGTDSPYAGYANEIDIESNLDNLFFPDQRAAQSKYIPDSSSDLYQYSIPSAPCNNPHPFISKTESFSPFNPNECNLGNEQFFNFTRQQVKNLKI
jgi:hypothetical protein